jgi:ADP-ribose pyrophosphatase YjhB (NUDIX family)
VEEVLHAFNKNGEIIKTENRKTLLKEIRDFSRANGDANWSVEVINLMLSNAKGDLYIVKRGDKDENPNMFDKTAGGHVAAGESYLSTLYREAREEIGVEALLTDMSGFPDACRHTDTSRFAVVRPVDYVPWMKSIRNVKEGKPWGKRHKVMIYAGRYDGDVKFVDGEATELLLIQKDHLLKKIDESPDCFTYDLKILLNRYSCFF